MHDITVIRQAHVELDARQHASELLHHLERCAKALGPDSPIGTDAQALVDSIYGNARKLSGPLTEAQTGPVAYTPYAPA